MVASNRLPAVCNAVPAFSCKHCLGVGKAVVESDESFSAGIESVDIAVHRIDGIVVPALTILGFVVDRIPEYLHLTGGKIALEV